MKPIEQNQNNLDDNCLQACIASVLELSIEDVPNFAATDRGNGEYIQSLNNFLIKYNLQALSIWFGDWDDPANWTPAGYHLIYGISPRGLKHAVVGYQGEMVFDPHPSHSGLVKIENYTVFVSTCTKI